MDAYKQCANLKIDRPMIWSTDYPLLGYGAVRTGPIDRCSIADQNVTCLCYRLTDGPEHGLIVRPVDRFFLTMQ